MAVKRDPTQMLRESRAIYLTDAERSRVARFLERLNKECGDQIARVILFGSRARGDHDAESDIDLLIVTRNGKQAVDAVATRLMGDPDFVSPLVLSAEDYREHQRLRDPLYVNIRRDGIELWDPESYAAEKQSVPIRFPEGELRPMDEATREVVKLYMEQAHRMLDEARFLLTGQFTRGPSSRAYYAVFHSTTAALYALNVVRGKHSGVQSALSQFLVQPGLLEEEYKDIFNRLYKYRETSDYEPRKEPALDQARELVADAERFVARIEQFLKERGAWREAE